MAKREKICFVIMGFGKKTDYSTGKTFDLNQTYKNIIKPAVQSSGFYCVRADEINDSGLIDRSMYALLMRADLVIADISTFNPNAIYELGIRHAVRPYSTIIIKEEEGKIPFDLDHTRIFCYKHSGDDIGTDEAKRCQSELSRKIDYVTKQASADSPLYEIFNNVTPPVFPDEEYDNILDDLASNENHIFAIVEKAKDHMVNDRFEEASELWKRATELAPTEDYFKQQQALSTYKSKKPSELMALTDALKIIDQLLPDDEETNDPETLGITGAIYKRMWLLTKDVEYLKKAVGYYSRGFQIKNDYYTGENYALCLDIMSYEEQDKNEKIFLTISAKKAREKIIDILKQARNSVTENNIVEDFKWAYATLSNCYYGLGNDTQGIEYENLFRKFAEGIWEIKTFEDNKTKVLELTRGE